MLRSFCVLAAAAAFVVAAAPAASAYDVKVQGDIVSICHEWSPETGICWRSTGVCSELDDASCNWSPGTDVVCVRNGPTGPWLCLGVVV